MPQARPIETFYRRNLPHIQPGQRPVFVTFATRNRWVLPKPIRDIVLRHCLRDHRRKIIMHGCVVMPDHVHLVFTPLPDASGTPYGLAEIMSGIKGASAHSINKALSRKGSVWQDESFDHILRRNESVRQKVEYICHNPVRKGIVASEDDYPWLWREWIDDVESSESPPRAAVPHTLYIRIAKAAHELNDQRERWLNPPEWIQPIADAVDAEDDFADVPKQARPLIRRSAIMVRAGQYPRLKKRTLTNLYNERPTWLKLAHEKLDCAVLAAYAETDPEGNWSQDWAEVWTETGAGSPLSDDHRLADRRKEIDQQVLANLLRLNLRRANARNS